MRAGQLRQRIVIEQRTDSPSPISGAPSPEWTRVLETWAQIEPLSGRQLLAAQAIQNEITHRVRIRYQPGLAPTMRVTFGARYFDILALRNVEERNRELELDCREGLSDG